MPTLSFRLFCCFQVTGSKPGHYILLILLVPSLFVLFVAFDLVHRAFQIQCVYLFAAYTAILSAGQSGATLHGPGPRSMDRFKLGSIIKVNCLIELFLLEWELEKQDSTLGWIASSE